MHLHLHASLQKAMPTGRPAGRGPMTVSRNAVLGLIDSLKSTVRRLWWRPSGQAGPRTIRISPILRRNTRSGLIRKLLERTKAGTAWDLVRNTGAFSRIAAETGISTVAFDYDPACIERMYLEAKDRGETRLRPLVLDLFNPSSGSGWWNRERASIFDRGSPDVVMLWP